MEDFKRDENSWTTAALKNDKDTLYMYYLVDDNYYNLIYEEYLLEWTFLPVPKLLRDTRVTKWISNTGTTHRVEQVLSLEIFWMN